MTALPERAAPRLPPIVVACLAATWLIWGSTYLAIRFALVSFPPYIQMGSRFLVAGAGLGAWMHWVRGVPWPGPRQWGHAFVIGGLRAVAIGCVCWCLGSVLSQRRFPLAAGAMGFASEMLAGGVVLMALAAVARERWHWPPQPLAVGAWAYLVVFGSLLAFNAYMVLLARTPAGLAASYTFVNPVIALFLGIVVGGESVTPQEWAATGVILVGVILLLAGSMRRAASQAPRS